MLAQKSRGITPSDLRGKKNAPVKATTAHFYIDDFLASKSLPRNDVEIVFVNKKQRPQAIAKGGLELTINR